MKKILFMLIVLSNAAFAQYKFKLTSGNFKALKGQTSVNVVFSYEGMIVGDDDKNEAQYVELNVKQQDAKGGAGKGEAWKKTWYSNKLDIYEPKFCELLEKYSHIANTNDRNAKYTIMVHVTMMRTGFVAWGPVRSNAKINADISLVESQDQSVSDAAVEARDMPGRTGSGYDFNASERLRECFAKTGKELGRLIWQQVKK